MIYRREIDGLRALAVLPVMLFHAGFERFSGGFIGVDVFFVISGYLITSILYAEFESGTFTLLGFYERRARRILPALILVAAACLPFAWWWLVPSDMRDFSASLAATSASMSNIYFYLKAGYFDSNSDLKPLLHTWSLAVEEQYYLLFPPLLMLTWRLGRVWMTRVLAGMLVASFALAQWASNASPDLGFYLLPTRAWELLAGSLIAFYLSARPPAPSGRTRLREVTSVLGVLMLGYAVLALDRQTPFPGVYALLPVVGTALIIVFATPETHVGRLLGTRVLVGIGLISYSAYLWHQPIYAFARQHSAHQLDALTMVVLLLGALVLAAWSWKFVELPFRNRARYSRRSIFTFGAIGSGTLFLAGVAGYLTHGFPDREAHRHLDSFFSEGIACDYPTHGYRHLLCGASHRRVDAQRSILFVGDSLLNSVSDGISRAANDLGVPINIAAKGGCPTLMGITAGRNPALRSACTEFSKRVFDFIAEERVSHVVLVSAFNRYLGNGKAGEYRDAEFCPTRDKCIDEFGAALRYTVDTLRARGVRVFVVKQQPNFGLMGTAYQSLSRMALLQGVAALSMPMSIYAEDSAAFDTIMAGDDGVISYASLLCDGTACSPARDGQMYYVNGDHFGAVGAQKLVDFWREQLPRLMAR